MTRWSQLKKAVESHFADKVRGRVELRAAGYRRAYEQEGRGYITLDGEEIWTFCSFEAMKMARHFCVKRTTRLVVLTSEQKKRNTLLSGFFGAGKTNAERTAF